MLNDWATPPQNIYAYILFNIRIEKFSNVEKEFKKQYFCKHGLSTTS